MTTQKVSDDSFEADVLKSETPGLVDFWAEWCGPCKQIAPALEEIGAELEGRLTIAKINIDENPQTPTKYRVRGIPTLLLFKGRRGGGDESRNRAPNPNWPIGSNPTSADLSDTDLH